MAEAEGDAQSAGYLTSTGTDWIRIQRSTFTNWCNEHLRKKGRTISDLVGDLKDGVSLILLVEELSKKDPPRLVVACRLHFPRPHVICD